MVERFTSCCACTAEEVEEEEDGEPEDEQDDIFELEGSYLLDSLSIPGTTLPMPCIVVPSVPNDIILAVS